MNLYTYVAENNPKEANKLLSNYGFQKTNNYDVLISRLKEIVRKYKKVALQDIVGIHPDISLFNSFTKSATPETEFAYATGRTPGFAEPIVEPKSNFIEKDNTNTDEILAQIRDVKSQIRANRKRNKPIMQGNMVNQAGLSQSNVLMIAVAFALGYLIAKK